MSHEPEYRVVPQSVLQALSTVEVEPAPAPPTAGPLIAFDRAADGAEIVLADTTGTLVFFMPSDTAGLVPMECIFPQADCAEDDVLSVYVQQLWQFNPGGVVMPTTGDAFVDIAISVDGGVTWLANLGVAQDLSLAANGNAEPNDQRGALAWKWSVALPPVTGDVHVRLFGTVVTPADAVIPTMFYEGDENAPHMTCHLFKAASSRGIAPSQLDDVTAAIVDPPPIVV